MYDTDTRKVLSALCHGAIFFNFLFVSIGLPIIILFATQDPVVKENAKEAINFHLNVWLYGIIIGALVVASFGLLGFVGFLWFLVHWGLTIWALFHVLSNSETAFRYPFIFRIV
ncbi:MULTISPECIES: DUF4870 domain-containing protein [Nostocales]|uniref:DUF4870 domain-containing protein n=3 Tax=Nostocales TaxID=1161 RepID=A0A0C1NEL6_9CYAN|nr:DUF4870 domain-containing protein [Tolypothrix bouteillei]KAF3887763.1 DUF4870 domain-containing protein [Tolypothrix bouteillei VB521301]